MSLVAWFPLNGNITNHGYADITPIVSVTPNYVSGKTGKCIATGSFYLSANDTAKVLHKTTSICLWFKALGDDVTHRQMIFGNNINRRFSLFQYPTANDFHWYFTNDNSYVYSDGIMQGVLPKDVWTHICVTQDEERGRIRVYINGDLMSSKIVDIKNMSITFNDATTIVHDTAYHNICDLRIYDHELSVKEIHEIMKNCILHIDFNNPAVGRENLVTMDRCYTSSNFTMTKKYDADSGYYHNFKLTLTGTGSNAWDFIRLNNFKFTVGKVYYYSCKVRVHKANFSIQLRASRVCNDWSTRMVTVSNSYLADGNWHEYSTYQTINDTFDRNGSTIKCDPILEFYTQSLVTARTVYECDIDIKDCQVVEAPFYISYLPPSWTKDKIYDSSGFGNHGTIYGTVPIVQDSTSPIGSCSATFGGTENYISFGPAINMLPTDEITVSAWAYLQNWNVATNMRVISCTETGGFQLSLNDNSGYVGCSCYVSGKYMQALYNRSKVTAGWHMMTLTFDGLNLSFYLDGVKVGGQTISSKGTISYNSSAPLLISGEPNSSTTTGFSWMGSIADVRIYASALSTVDVLQLYNSKAQISSNGVLFGSEFEETGNKMIVSQAGIVKTSEIMEESSLTDKIKIKKDGSITVKEIIEH